jgi:hypothetical protein
MDENVSTESDALRYGIETLVYIKKNVVCFVVKEMKF